MYRLVSWMSGAARRDEIAEPLVQGGFGEVSASEAESPEAQAPQGVAVSVREGVVTVEPVESQPRPPRRQIEVKIVE